MRYIVLSAAMLLLCLSAYPQDRKAEREARRQERRETRRLERAIMDSLRLHQLEEETVNVGYGSVKKKNLTNAVSKVTVEQNEVGAYTHIGEYLAGRVPGLIVRRTGSGYSYNIRGATSIYGSTEPLFIVDGMEVMDIDYLNPRDVKNVEVLKDGSASIYGTKGACGVILITTHRAGD